MKEDIASSTSTPQPTTKPIASATPTPAACNKMVKYDDKTGIVPNRYVLMLKKHTAQNDMTYLIKLLKSLVVLEAHNVIEVKKVIPAEGMKMITVEMNQAGLEYVSYK